MIHAISPPAPAEWVPCSDLLAWDRNPKPHDESNVKEIARSIRRFDFGAPIVAWRSKRQVVAGHGRLLGASLLMREDPGRLLATDAPGPGLVPVRWMEFASESEAAAYALADNRLTEVNPMTDAAVADILREIEAEGGDINIPGYSEDDLKALLSDQSESLQTPDQTYTSKIKLPTYEPRGIKPTLSQLYDNTKTQTLESEIKAAPIPEDIRSFLLLAAQRHTSFHYRNIAEFYCHAPKEVQVLFEKSALVIIDIDQAIANGFVKVTERLAELAGLDGNDEE